MIRPIYYRRDGTPYNDNDNDNVVIEWGKDFNDPAKKVVKQDRLENGLFVSTVWLGIDHSFGVGPPLIFETMVFSKADDNLEIDRYSTEAHALAGHRRLVKKWSS